MTTKATLAFYVDDFKKWRKENYTDEQIADNVPDDVSYPRWIDLENYFSYLLDTKQISQLDKEDKVNLLYLFARGWDNAAFLNELTEDRPISGRGNLTDEDFIRLAHTATTLSGTEYNDGKASIAMCFRKFEYLTLEIENILLKLYEDNNEYTKRMALLTLAKLGYKGTVALVEKSWTIEHEWHKLVCLSILEEYVKDDALLMKYISEAIHDDRQHLREHALAIKARKNC